MTYHRDIARDEPKFVVPRQCGLGQIRRGHNGPAFSEQVELRVQVSNTTDLCTHLQQSLHRGEIANAFTEVAEIEAGNDPKGLRFLSEQRRTRGRFLMKGQTMRVFERSACKACPSNWSHPLVTSRKLMVPVPTR